MARHRRLSGPEVAFSAGIARCEQQDSAHKAPPGPAPHPLQITVGRSQGADQLACNALKNGRRAISTYLSGLAQPVSRARRTTRVRAVAACIQGVSEVLYNLSTEVPCDMVEACALQHGIPVVAKGAQFAAPAVLLSAGLPACRAGRVPSGMSGNWLAGMFAR